MYNEHIKYKQFQMMNLPFSSAKKAAPTAIFFCAVLSFTKWNRETDRRTHTHTHTHTHTQREREREKEREEKPETVDKKRGGNHREAERKKERHFKKAQ